MPGGGNKPAKKSASPTRTTARAKKSSVTVAENFYGSALEAAEQIEVLKEAAGVEGLDEEIAVLRMKLRSVLSERPDDLALMLRGIDLLVKAVSARYRLSKDEEEEVTNNLETMVEYLGRLLAPDAFREEDAGNE